MNEDTLRWCARMLGAWLMLVPLLLVAMPLALLAARRAGAFDYDQDELKS